MLGFNTGYIEELYKQFLEDPGSVSEDWQEFFADYTPSEAFQAATAARNEAILQASGGGDEQVATVARGTGAEGGDGAVAEPEVSSIPVPDDAEIIPLRGPSAKIAENMEASLSVPTATSVRTFPVKLMAENRGLINAYQKTVGGEKVSFTHLIGWAIVKAMSKFPAMNSIYRVENGQPQHVIPAKINLGLAIDIERRGRRTLMVPNVKDTGSMNFPQFLGIYNDLVKRARDGKLEISDFAGTTATLTNPGMIGTSLSVPRLMQGQGVIVGVGSIGYPESYHAFAPEIVSRTGISQVMTITSTYDHRVIQGAESGGFLAYIAKLLQGEDTFFDTIFAELGVPYAPYHLANDTTPRVGSLYDEMEMTRKQARVLQLIRAYRVRGHLQADINPLGYDWVYHPELDPATYGLTIWDLDRRFVTGDLGGQDVLPLRTILDILRKTYAHKVGVEYMHISDPGEKKWIQDRLEPVTEEQGLTSENKRRILSKLNAAEAFERFLHTKYIGHKRFSLEGSETIIPMLDAMLNDASDTGVREVVIGMAHRGRLNVLANILQKPYEVIFSEFEGNIDPNTTQGSGDVKYHLGFSGEHKSPAGNGVDLTLASNPSHLEAVDPVVEGMVRAKQTQLLLEEGGESNMEYVDAVIPVLIHGDAAFAGQGVIAETLNLSQLPGYHTGGTIHFVINNQIGFTTTPQMARSSTYATDIARMIQAPIIHVNGDDPEACVRVVKLALEYRQKYNKDVVVDMLCYRVHGHNEGDEPTYTQPLLYKKIEAKRSVRKLYTEALLGRGEMEPEEAEQMLADYRSRMQEAFDATKEIAERDAAREVVLAEDEEEPPLEVVDTGAPMEAIENVKQAILHQPEGFETHPKLLRQFQRRAAAFDEDKVDWGFGEALAFGTLLLEGTNVRLAGQDSRRGTFSHRHAAIVDQSNGDEYLPLRNLSDSQGYFMAYDSLLSEYAAVGFEYGYSEADKSALVIWEAQFGDFANGAQIVFDQFLSSAKEKWGRSSSLVLLLPHGYEGQGPEHSSARLERFLQLCAENNMNVCNFTTPANLFHALRRQVKRTHKSPLIVMSPKSLLRHPGVVSTRDDFTHGTVQEIIPATADASTATKLLFCSGKIYFDLIAAVSEDESAQGRVAITRVEQYYPFPEDAVRAELDRYSGVSEVAWVQEEPANMGAWNFIRPLLDDLLADVRGEECADVVYHGRREAASPSNGSAKVHQLEQERIVKTAIAAT
ncbi:MAG: multifunctional oxoglutarate decarboxylase/oxoglutarate dehydrogenase thiamine pyrophosphate-binding subunit/dihydrolipoyllysine-residue succinyltransferase subunit [Rhodothermales bacterium]|nr:multifunctional oxoglutarate decarboxylase/oxoglutarate dehydrogenase thiamine pyrophosphate-binding subunit/dihydrolipoyllysine-residue succinyltransferase subunit [Rhodothermales bacterium]